MGLFSGELVFHATFDESVELLQLAAETHGFRIVSDLDSRSPVTVEDVRKRKQRDVTWVPIIGLVGHGVSRGVTVVLSRDRFGAILAGKVGYPRIGRAVFTWNSAELAQVVDAFTSRMVLHRTPLQEGWLSPRVRSLVLEHKVWLSGFAELTRTDVSVPWPVRGVPAKNVAPLRLLDVPKPAPDVPATDEPAHPTGAAEELELPVGAEYYEKKEFHSFACRLSPTPRKLAGAIARIDGDRFPAVILNSPAGARCYVGGGYDDLVICEVEGLQLVDPDVDPAIGDGAQPLDNGEEQVFPGPWSVPKAMAIAAALYFAEHGTFDPDATWERGEIR